MTRRFAAVALTLACVAATPAYARHHSRIHHRHVSARPAPAEITCDHGGCRAVATRQAGHVHRRNHNRDLANPLGKYSGWASRDPRPRAWCGWWLRHELGIADRSLNLARAWARFGSRASGPAPGVIAVWPHHVGIVVAVAGPGEIILKSGNDGHAVRTRERSTRGVIAWRWPSQHVASR